MRDGMLARTAAWSRGMLMPNPPNPSNRPDPVAQAAQHIQQQRSQVSERDRLLAEVYRRTTLREQRELAETMAYVKSYVEWLRSHGVPPKKLGLFRRSAWPIAAE